MTYYDDPEGRYTGPSRRRFVESRSPKKRGEAREMQRRARHVPPETFIDRKAMAAPPGSDLAKARIAAHNAFDPLWQVGGVQRAQAYAWLAAQMGLPIAACHMVLFDINQCAKVVSLCNANPACVAAADKQRAEMFDRLEDE